MKFLLLILTCIALISCSNGNHTATNSYITSTLKDSPVSVSIPKNLFVTERGSSGYDKKTDTVVTIPTLDIALKKGFILPSISITRLRNTETFDDHFKKLKYFKNNLIKPAKYSVLNKRKTLHTLYSSKAHFHLVDGKHLYQTLIHSSFIVKDNSDFYSCQFSSSKLEHEQYKDIANKICKSIKFKK